MVGLAAALHARMQASRAPPFWARHAFEHVANLIIGSLRLDDFEREALGVDSLGLQRFRQAARSTGLPWVHAALQTVRSMVGFVEPKNV